MEISKTDLEFARDSFNFSRRRVDRLLLQALNPENPDAAQVETDWLADAGMVLCADAQRLIASSGPAGPFEHPTTSRIYLMGVLASLETALRDIDRASAKHPEGPRRENLRMSWSFLHDTWELLQAHRDSLPGDSPFRVLN